jgi:hypothetical protein
MVYPSKNVEYILNIFYSFEAKIFLIVSLKGFKLGCGM